MFAIIKTGGKQLKVLEGDEIFVEKLELKETSKVIFKEVLMIDDNIGSPLLKNAQVEGTVLKQGRERKIVVYKYKPKKNQHKKYGHRQPYTKIKIDSIVLDSTIKVETKKVAKVAKKVEAKKAVKVAKVTETPKAKPAKVAKVAKKVEAKKEAKVAKK